MIFGKTTLRSGREWIEGGFKNLSADQTATYRALLALDVSQADAFELMKQLRGAEKTDTMSRAQVQEQILRDSALEGEAVGTVFYDLLASEKEQALMDKLLDAGGNIGEAALTLMELGNVSKKPEKLDALIGSGLTDEELEIFAPFILGEDLETETGRPTGYAKYLDAVKSGLNRRSALSAIADGLDLGDYLDLKEAGLKPQQALDMAQELNELVPEEGRKSPTDLQKYRVAIDNSVSESNQLKLLQAAGMSGSTYQKVEAGQKLGVAPAAWVRAQELKSKFDEDGSGGLAQKEWEKLIDSMSSFGIVLPGDNARFNLTNDQKAILWQMLTGSKSTKNNPFSAAAGQKWLDAMGYE